MLERLFLLESLLFRVRQSLFSPAFLSSGDSDLEWLLDPLLAGDFDSWERERRRIGGDSERRFPPPLDSSESERRRRR